MATLGLTLPPDVLRRLAVALCTLAGPLLVWAVGLPREVYTGAFVLGGALAALLVVRGTRGPRLPVVALAWVGVLASIVLADLVLRSPLASRLYPQPALLDGFRWPVNPDLYRYRANARFEGKVFGDLAGVTGRESDREEREIVFSTGPRGFRNPPPLPAGPLDAVLLGDSFAAGTGSSDEETWLSQLRRTRGIETYSLSIPGSPWGELLNLKSELPGLSLRPGTTVIWALFTGNDLEDRYRDYLDVPEPNGPLARISVRFTSFRRRSPLRRAWQARFGASLTVERAAHDPSFLYVRDYAERSRRSADEVRAHSNWPRLEGVFASMAELARERELRVVVAVIPTKWETYAWLLDPARGAESASPSGFASAIEELGRDHDFAFVDLKPDLVADAREAWRSAHEYVFWRDDTHWNGRGQRVAARVLAPLIPR